MLSDPPQSLNSSERLSERFSIHTVKCISVKVNLNLLFDIDSTFAIKADPINFNHDHLFSDIQRQALNFRMNEPICSLVGGDITALQRDTAYTSIPSQGWFSPGQVFVLDEYCARYMVRGCYRHVTLLSNLLDKADQGQLIDPTLIHYSFAFCASHVHGNRLVCGDGLLGSALINANGYVGSTINL